MIPVLDKRDSNILLNEIKALASSYTPDWSFDLNNPDPGTALAIVYADMMAETIKRYNLVLKHNQMAFMNMLNTRITPAQPSETYATVVLSTGAKEQVLIPSGTKILAENLASEPVIFETINEMLATPAVPNCAFISGNNPDYINAIDKQIFSVEDPGHASFMVFADNSAFCKNLQENSLYLNDPILFSLTEPTVIRLKFANAKKRFHEKELNLYLSSADKCNWQFLSAEDQWHDFDEFYLDHDVIVLAKKNRQRIVAKELNGSAGCWLRCRMDERFKEEFVLLEFDSLTASCAYLPLLNQGINPDWLFLNDINLRNESFYPFGETFSIYDCFYIACNEGFAKKGARITLLIDMEFEVKAFGIREEKIKWRFVMKKHELQAPPPPPEVFISSVVWEYWNGQQWVRLEVDYECERIFEGPKNESLEMNFICPADIEKAPIGSALDYFIRARIVKVENHYIPSGIAIVPFIKSILIDYSYLGEAQEIYNIYSLSNAEWKDWSRPRLKGDEQRATIIPFELMESQFPTLYLGFDIPPLKGPIHLYFSLRKINDQSVSFQTVWEYGTENDWKTLRVIDNTEGFSLSGSVIFNGPAGLSRKSLFDQDKYWIRASSRTIPSKASNIVVEGIYINTVNTVQQESIFGEIPKIKVAGLEIECQLSRFPVIAEEVWINEADTISEREQAELIQQNQYNVEYSRDEYGRIEYFWVQWTGVADFLTTHPYDRHYIADKSTGTILLSEKYCSKVFSKGLEHRIKVNYKLGGGARGVIKPYAVKGLQGSIAFVDKVFNHQGSFGGCEMEMLAEAIKRSSKAIKHRNRAVAESDFESLVLEASRNVAKVKCIPNMNASLEKETGCLMLVIMPKGESMQDNLFSNLVDDIKKNIMEKASGMVAFADRINVIAPVFVEFSINAEIVTDDMEGVIALEKEIQNRLTTYLNPHHGNSSGQGWEIGEHPHASNFFALLKQVKTIKYIGELTISMHEVRFGKRFQISQEKCDLMSYSMIRSGEHQININIVGEEI